MPKRSISIPVGSAVSFSNNAAYCIGTGRMGLALQKEYLDQLKTAQSLASFSHIRGHGLFSDDMGIYQPYTDKDGVSHDEYCFTYLDRVMDSYLENGLKPFLELGFMPHRMASGTQTVFYWKGNVTPPAEDEKWINLVKATIRHLIARYGEEEVASWPVEVWNEPNLEVFWENADKAKYLHLYKITSLAVKEALPAMRVGGPAICGSTGWREWMHDFLSYCRNEKLPLDFVTRHAYMGQNPTRNGRYLYHDMCDVAFTYNEMKESREIIDSYPEYKGLEMHITEFNTSYNPFCPIHDTNRNAAYIAGLLSCLGDFCASYSYWTFGDVFEEGGVPARPFHGGFGLIANEGILKPTMWTFAFFNNLKGECIYRDENAVIMRRPDGKFEGVLWNLARETKEPLTINLSLPAEGKQTLLMRITDEETTNPLKVWNDMGQPRSLTKEQLAFLKNAAQPKAVSDTVEGAFDISLNPNAVVHFTLSPALNDGDYGYDYSWYEDSTVRHG